jgi:hypothetical protein
VVGGPTGPNFRRQDRRIICNGPASKRFDYAVVPVPAPVPVPDGVMAAASAVPSGDPKPVQASHPGPAA